LRDTYKTDSEKYQAGLMGAAAEDFKTGYQNWAQNRAFLVNRLENDRNFRKQKELADIGHKFTAEQNELNWARRDAESAKDRELRERQFDENLKAQKEQNRAQNALSWSRLNGRTSGVAGTTGTKGMKTVVFSVDGAQKGSYYNGSGYYKVRNYTPAQYQSLVLQAKKAIDGATGVMGNPVRKRLGLPENAKLSDDDYIRYYAILQPQLLAEEFTLDEPKGTTARATREDEFEEFAINP
jgi:hypothetical protein